MSLRKSHRRPDGRSLALLFLLVVLSSPVLPGALCTERPNDRPGGAVEPVKRPNILLVNVDDMSTFSMEALPRVAEFFEKGVTFTSAYVPNPLCCPSRASLLTGRYPHSTDFWFNGESRAHMVGRGGARAFHARRLDRETFAPRLKEKGYLTGFVGKYLNGYQASLESSGLVNPPGWDDWHVTTAEIHNGYYGYDLIENGRRRSYGSGPEDYSTDVFARKAIRFVSRAGELERPWFLCFAPFAPHGPTTPAGRHLDLHPDLEAPRLPSFGVPGIDKPLWVVDQPGVDPDAEAQIDRRFADTARALAAVDEAFQKMLETLEASGQLSRTVVIFTSDNGYSFGLHNWRKKQCYYDQVARVPLAILDPRDPRRARGRSDDTLVVQLDLFPTILEYAGFTAEELATLPLDGVSLVPLVRGETTGVAFRDGIVLESRALRLRFNDCRPAPPGPLRITCDLPDYEGGIFETAGRGRWKYIRLANRNERELLDLRNDPFELVNVYQTADPLLIEELEARLDSLLGRRSTAR